MQLELLPIEQVERQESIGETFIEFHRRNPHIYHLLKDYALLVKRAGRKIGMKALFERIRWDYMVQSRSQTEYKLNNNFTAYYARLLMDAEPELAGFFETRGRQHDQ